MANVQRPQPALSAFDTTSLVVGAVIGADIYVVASLGAGLLGPAMLVAWVIAGIVAGLIALTFAQCAALVAQTGGSYAYTRSAFGDLAGFLAGWTLYLAELVSIAVFPTAFVRYLDYLVPGINGWQALLAKVGFVAFLIVTNIIGTRRAGRVNDALTIGKLGPLLLLIFLGVGFVATRPATVAANLTPFAPLGWTALGQAIILAYWAYAGFELAVLPSSEIVAAERTLPRAMAIGMGIATAFYLLVNAAVAATIPWQILAQSTAPLAIALQTMIASLLATPNAWIGGLIMSLGAILSISGADESSMLGTSRLSSAMAADGYLPQLLSRPHPRYHTPYLGVIFQGLLALAASIVGSLTGLIQVAVFFLSLAYLATVLAAMRLTCRASGRRFRSTGARLLRLLALGGVLYLLSQTERKACLLGAALLLVGLLIYARVGPRRHQARERKRRTLPREQQLAEVERALLSAPAHALESIRRLLRK